MWRIIKTYYPYIFGMAFFAFLFRAIVFYDELPWHINLGITFSSIGVLFLIWFFFDWVNAVLNAYLPYQKHFTKRVIFQTTTSLLLTYLILNSIFYANAYFYKVVELGKIVVVAGNLIWTLIILIVNGFFIGEYFFNQWKQALTKSIETERNLIKMQFLNLQNQLNPHFLFNSLTTLHSLIHENPALASHFLKQLAATYRYLLRHNQDTWVVLSEEIGFVEQYLSLLKTRFGEAFLYELRQGRQGLNKKIIPVTLQILIENAVKHNQMSIENPLKVEIYLENEYICVKNLKNLKKNAVTSTQIGLTNLQKLYQATAPNMPVLIENEGAFFIVKIPLL